MSANHDHVSSDARRCDLSDRVLFERAATDPEAFALIYRRYYQIVYRFGRAMTGSPTTADDITQEVFVILFANLARFDPGRASFATYLYGIVRNLSRDRLRRERRFLSLERTTSSATRASYVDDPRQTLEDAERAAAVRRCLLRLPARYRELIVLCDLHDLSYAEAGVVVGISTAAVRSRLHRGRQLVRQRLARVARPEPQRRLKTAGCAL